MPEDALREQFVEVLREKFRPQFEKNLRVKNMSEEEFAVFVDGVLERMNSARAKLPKFTREQIEGQFRKESFADPNAREQGEQREADLLMPHLLWVRKRLGINGPVTREQADAAGDAFMLSRQDGMLAAQRELLAKERDPARAEIMQKLIEHRLREKADFEELATTLDREKRQTILRRMVEEGRESARLTAELLRTQKLPWK